MMNRRRASLLVLLIAAAFAVTAGAQMHDRGARPGNGIGGGMGMMDVIVAADGTAIAVRRAPQRGGTPAEDVVAVTPTGAVAWTWKSSRAVQTLSLAGRLVLAATTGSASAMPMRGETQLVALSLGEGTQAWTLAIDGNIVELRAAPTQIYALVMQPTGTMTPGTPGSGNGKRTLVAISMSGAILWSMPLD